MKKLMTIAMVMILVAVSLIGSKPMAQAKTKHIQYVDITNKHGFMVLDRKEKKNRTTVVSKVVTGKSLGVKLAKGEVAVQNLFDYADYVILTKKEGKGLKLGDIVLVTYNGDWVEKVKKNNLNIHDKVIGQKINKKLDVFVYAISQIGKKEVYGKAISDRSFNNAWVILNRSDLSGMKLKKGYTMIVTFKHGKPDDIRRIDVIQKFI